MTFDSFYHLEIQYFELFKVFENYWYKFEDLLLIFFLLLNQVLFVFKVQKVFVSRQIFIFSKIFLVNYTFNLDQFNFY